MEMGRTAADALLILLFFMAGFNIRKVRKFRPDCVSALSRPTDRARSDVVAEASVASATQEECRLARSEFLHLARKPVSKKASMVRIPFVAMVVANPLGVRVAGLPNVDHPRSGASVIGAVVMFHGSRRSAFR